uniref:LisH domain-containing protein n=1 Tax=Angiostrongylus cantonensis TaxID=6313 RepID=A0A0K0D5M4_ANGCA
MSFSSNELNYIVWRYLSESGFEHSAYVFAMESNLLDSDIDCTEVASGALVMMVQRGLFYAEAEFRAMANPDHTPLFDEKTDTLGLIEAGKDFFRLLEYDDHSVILDLSFTFGFNW